ncbi:MAG TPA: DUF4129 domain-containing protein [Candidatus Angelobacter sp.]|nr:DUF4129 domain-containing protein [Candidatus Angelobacter sp.]
MKQRCAINSILVSALLACFCALTAGAESISVAQYRQQLHDVEQKIDALKADPGQAGKLVAEIPDAVSVTASSGEVKVNYKPLKSDLATLSSANKEKRAPLMNQIQNYVQALTNEADAYDSAGTNLSVAHGKLTAILSTKEFNKVRGPNVKDALLARIFRWIARHLRGFGGNSTFDLIRFFIYLLVAIAAIFLLIWTIRRLRRPQEELPQREIIPFSPSARSWRVWLTEARNLAQQQDWRNAIHLAYWAGISYLEEHGAWKPNRARTPREYLRLIGSRAAQYPVLAALTRKLEHVWYGYGEAEESDFHDTLSQLEKLGCR